MLPNPNPTRISEPMWWYVNACAGLTPTSFARENGGIWYRKGGSHSDTKWLKVNRPNDYSLRGAKQAIYDWRGNFGRAWDWTFPSAQAGNWSEIGVYSRRFETAWRTNDPRKYMLFEVLCQTPEDKQPEGFVFYPTKGFRVPDSTHEWHIHLGVLTEFIDSWTAFEDLLSLTSGESLQAWYRRKNPSTPTDLDQEDTMYFKMFMGPDKKVYMTSGAIVWELKVDNRGIGGQDADAKYTWGDRYLGLAGGGSPVGNPRIFGDWDNRTQVEVGTEA